MSGQMWWSRDADRTAHADDSILLAYIRQQSLGKSRPDIHQHIAHCEECQRRCKELRQTSTMLDDTLHRNSSPLLKEDEAWDWLQSPIVAQVAYQRRQRERLHEDLSLGIALITRLPLILLALLAQAVPALLPYVRKLKPEPQRRGNRVMNFAQLLSIPVVAFLVLALTALLVLAELNGHYSLNPFHLSGSITTTAVPSTIVVPAHPTPTLATVAQSGVTLTPSGPIPTIFECNNDKTPHRFDICGKNFKPSTRVELVIQFGDGSSKTRHSVGIDQSGKFQIFLAISSCKDVPTTILAQNMAHPSVNLGVLQNIQYGKCSSR